MKLNQSKNHLILRSIKSIILDMKKSISGAFKFISCVHPIKIRKYTCLFVIFDISYKSERVLEVGFYNSCNHT